MADSEATNSFAEIKHPQVIFIRLGKDKSKDSIQNEVFKGIRKAFIDSETTENDSKKEKNRFVLPDIEARDIQDVALGEEYVGLLLKDGRVCRFKCVCSNVTSSSKSQKAPSSSEGPIFQVQSDEAYARRLQEQLNSGQSSATNLGLQEPNFRPFYPVGESGLLESATFPNDASSSFASFLNSAATVNLGSNNSEGSSETSQQSQSTEDPAQTSTTTAGERTQSNTISTTNNTNSTNIASQSTTPPANTRGRSLGSGTSTSSQGTSTSTSRHAASQAPSYSPVSLGPSVQFGSLADRTNNNLRTTLVNSLRQRGGGECWAIPLPHRPHSPTVVQRTIFSAEPFLFRSARPVFVPSHVVFPGSLYSLDQRRLNRNLNSRTRGYLASQRGRRRFESHSASSTNNSSRRGSNNGVGDRTAEDADSEFHYPEIGDLEWLQTETGEDICFSHIAALHTEFILVEKTQGTLYHWPYTSSNPVAMEIDNEATGSPVYEIPKAKPSPLMKELNLVGESVSLLAAHRIRCSVVTKSGRVCTFYDKYIRECNKNQLPALLHQLSHPAALFPELAGDKVTAVDCSEFFSAVMTENGKVFWWGLLPSEERQDFKQKLSKTSSSTCSISVDDKVQLRQHLPGFPGALVYKSTENHGPQLARLLSHETEEGASQAGMKIKVEKIPKSNGKASKASPTTGKDEVLPLRVASPRQVMLHEGRSASPHTSIRNQSRSNTPVASNPDVETWDMKEVIFLESENKVLGTVAAIDGPHVIVKVANASSGHESPLRVFKVSELESVPGDVVPGAQGTSGEPPIKSSSPIYRGCLQNTPKCILDSTRCPDHTDKEVLTGFKPVSMASTAAGISVLVQNQENLKSYFIGPVIDRGNEDKVHTSSLDVASSRSNDDASVTVDSESVLSKDAALDAVAIPHDVKEAVIGQKRKHDDDDDDIDTSSSSQGFNHVEVPIMTDNSLASSKLSYSNTHHPSLHTTTGSNVVLLCDRNGCLYPRPFGTKLADPCATDLPPLQSFGMSQRIGFLSSSTNKEEQTLMVFVAFREQTLIPAIQSGIVSKVQDILDMLERLNTSKTRGRGKKSRPDHAVKRQAVQDAQGNVQQGSLSQEPEEPPELCSIVKQCLHDRTSSNQNLLHVCCTNPAFIYNPHDDQEDADKEGTIEKLLAEYHRAKSSSGFHGKHIEVEILDMLLQHPLFGPHIIPMLKEHDARGCTPFMLSIQCHNFKSALHILSFVEKNQGKSYSGVKVSLEDMIFPSTFNGTTPLHALGTACTENLPADGLGNSLTVSNLPSSYTPRILLKLFQARYPSAYRATIPPMVEEKKCPRAKTPRQRLMEKSQKDKDQQGAKKAADPKKGSLNLPSSSGTGHSARSMRYGDGDNNRIPIISSSRREALQGMVTFSDPKELRQALKEMDKHMVSSETLAPEGGLTSLVQHVLDVRLTEVSVEENEKLEMEVGIRGNVYNVSTSSGTTKISRKTQTSDGAEEKEGNVEDALICQLFSCLISYPEMAFAANKEQETVLAFLVNNSRWIKPSVQQSQRLVKYASKVFGSAEAPNKPNSPSSAGKQPSPSDEITAEIKITGSSGSSSIESNLLAQLDEISSSFKSLVDTLASLEGRPSEEPAQNQDGGPEGAPLSEAPVPEGATGTSRDLIDFGSPIPTPQETLDLPKDENLPIMIQLAQNWPCVVATVLGHFPEVTAEGTFEGLEVEMNEGLQDISGNASPGHTRLAPSRSCDIDGFVCELLVNTNKAVLVAFVDTIIREMNRYPADLTLESTQKGLNEEGPNTASRVAIVVGMKFLRAVIRQMSVHLSRSGVSYVDLRSRIGTGAATGGNNNTAGLEQNSSVEFKSKVRMVIRAYSWLGVQALVEAAEAIVLPAREGIAKAQARSTGASVSNNVPANNLFPGARYRGRPGIRVSQYDSRSNLNEPALRTAHRLPSDQLSTPVVRCRGTRLAAISEDVSSPAKTHGPSPSFLWSSGHSRAQDRRASVVDSDSDTDEDEGPLLRRALDDDSDIDLDDGESSSVSMAAGLNREHPYAWALDGRLTGFGDQGSSSHAHMSFSHYISNIVTPPSVHTGNCYLTRMFSRLVKETVDLVRYHDTDQSNSDTDGRLPDEPVLPVLSVSTGECSCIRERVTSMLDVSWMWLAKTLDVVEGQLHRGRNFDTKRYLSSLQRPEESEYPPLPRSASPMPGASPEEYLMFLLRAHSHEHSDTLPVIDMLCYEHMVYVLDAFIYSINNWPRPDQPLDRGSIDSEGITSAAHVSCEPGTSRHTTPPSSHPRNRHSKESEDCIKFYGMDVSGREKDAFLTNLQETLQQKSRMMVPKATWEVFTHNVGIARFKSVDESNKTRQGEGEEDKGLPVTYGRLSGVLYPTPLVMNWTADHVIDRWKIAVDLFSRLFLADGPGAERDSFLAARAGVAGRLASFRRKMLYLRESVTADTQQSGLAFSALGGRVGTTLSISVKRTRLLEDTLRILGEMQPFHYSNFRAKFEGEEGSGPGVNRGFFAAVANALKGDEKLPPETASLLHEPGKLPEQSGFYAPKPFAYPNNTRSDTQLKNRRHKMFTAIGRFIGLSLWFNNTVPLNFSRHVIKFLLNRDVTWEDLVFFNADLFEGLSRMMIDATHPLMTSETFQATYCCHFETSVGGTTEELIPGGSQLPVTPDNIYQYVRLYATKVMIGCVETELGCIRNGLYDVIPTELLSPLSPEDFQLLLSGGTTDIDMTKLRSVITFTNSNGCSKDILERFKRWFWSIVQKMTPLQRQQLLYFCTGSAVLPVMNDRRDPDQDLSITVDVISGNTKALPMATTCGQRMSVPLYPSKRILKKKLLQAIQCQSYGLG